MHAPKISIVTPSYNYGGFISDAIESVASQDYPAVEHIIVDGQSTDDTITVVERYAHLPHLRWISEPDEGQTDAINKGFRMATGDIVAWLNADDYYLPGALKHVAEVFRADPEADAVYGEALFVNGRKQAMRIKREHAFDWGVLLYYGCYIPSTTTFFRRRIVDDGVLLDASYRVTMDYEYFVRLAHLGYRFQFTPSVLAAFRWHGENVSTAEADRRREERLQVQRAYGFRWSDNDRIQSWLYAVAARTYWAKRQGLKLKRRFVAR